MLGCNWLLSRLRILRSHLEIYKVPQELISLSIVLCLFIHNIGSNHDRETNLTFFKLLPLQASLLREMNFCEFLGTFRYAAKECYWKICITDYSSYIKR